jgi:flagellar hook-associated protein 3 FlgL
MRVTDSFRYELYKINLSTLKEKMDKVSSKVASGRRILTPSEDPASFSKAVELYAQKDMNTQYRRNLETLSARGSYYETSINTTSDLLTRAKELAVQMSSDTVDAKARASAADEIDGIIESLTAVANTKVGNTYIFGGKRSNVAPYTLDQTTHTVTFNGTADVTKVAVNESTAMDAGVSGDRVFNGTVNLFDTLRNFSTALRNNDLAAMRTEQTNIDTAIDQTATNLSYVGTYNKKIETLITTNGTRDNTLTQTTSALMDADTVSLITDYNAMTAAYQAAAYTMSKVQNLSVLNYLR